MTPLSPKQRVLVAAMRERGSITLGEAVELVGTCYANRAFHVGSVLRRMMDRGMVRRVRRGVYALDESPKGLL